MMKKLGNYLKESSGDLIPVKNKYAEGKKLGPLERYNPNNPEHDDPKKYVYYTTGSSVFIHVLEVLKKIGADQPIIMLSSILHDIGKGPAFDDYKKGGVPSYHEHEEKSVDLVREIAKRLKMPKDVEEAILFAVGKHMKFHLFPKMKPSKIIKLIENDNWDVLVAVARADNLSRGVHFGTEKEFNDMIDKYVKMKESFGKEIFNKHNNMLDGIRIMKLTGLKPSKEVGIIKKIITDYIIDNNIRNSDEIDELILKEYNKLKVLNK